MNIIPGANDLGWGFNIFGSYADTSLKSRLFALRGGTTWKDPLNGNEYAIPDNVAQRLVEQNSAGSRVFQNRVQVQEFFSAKAGLEATYVTEFGAFSGAFNASYEVASEQDSLFQYALYEADNVAWELTLESQSVAQLTTEVQQEIAALPSSFSRETRGTFFRFFDKYGTHYVSQVKVGGRLYYYVAVAKSYLKNTEKIGTDVTLEFNALLVSGKAQSKAEWSTLTRAWTNNRTVHIEAVGGTPDTLLLAAPEYDDNRSAIFSKWVDSIKNAPATVDFELRPITALFPADKAEVVEQAMNAYFADNLLVVESRSYSIPSPEPSKPTHLPVVTLGGSIRPVVSVKHNFGFQLVVMQPTEDNYLVFLNKYYSIDLYAAQEGYAVIYDQMLHDLQTGGYTQPGYLVILTSFNWSWQAPPTSDFYAFLRSAGAGAALQTWMDGAQQPGSINSQDSLYILIGATGAGPNTGAEALAKAPLTGGPLTSIVAVRLHGLDIHRVSPPLALAKTGKA